MADELKINEEQIEFDKMLANRAAESQVLDEPRVPDLLPPPIKAPPLIQQPTPEIDWKNIQKAMDKARKAGMAYNPGGLSEFTQLMGNIQSIGQQAAQVASAFAPAPQVQMPQSYFPVSNIATNPNAGIYQQPHNFNLSTNVDYTAPTPQFGTGNNIFNADINYTIPTE